MNDNAVCLKTAQAHQTSNVEHTPAEIANHLGQPAAALQYNLFAKKAIEADPTTP